MEKGKKVRKVRGKMSKVESGGGEEQGVKVKK